MKKITILMLFVFVVSLLSCNNNSESYTGSAKKSKDASQTTSAVQEEVNAKATDDSVQKTQEVYGEGENYKIYDEDGTWVSYYIYDDNHAILDMGSHEGVGRIDISSRDSLLVLKILGGGPVWQERYYDTSQGIVSRFFEQPIQNTDKLVAYFEFRKPDKIVLVVQDIFDPKEFCLEIERDFSDFVLKDIAQAEFIESETKLKITYWMKPDDQQVTETIDLKIAEANGDF